MALAKRSKGPARWWMLVISGLSAAGFLGLVLAGPHPSDSGPPAPVATRAADVPAQPSLGQQPDQVADGLSAQRSVPRTTSAGMPRLRTRGS